MSGGTLHGFLTGRLIVTTWTAAPDSTTQTTVIRAERYRIRFDSPQQGALCTQTAGACRYVWNRMLSVWTRGRQGTGIGAVVPESARWNSGWVD